MNRGSTLKPTVLALVLLTLSINQSTVLAQLEAGALTVDSNVSQQVEIPQGSPLTLPPAIGGFGIPVGATFDLFATGSFSVGFDAESGGVAEISSFSALFEQTHPVLGAYDLLAVGNGPVQSFSGQLSNIDEAGGALVSADITLSTTLSLTFEAAPDAVLFARDPATFSGRIFADGTGTLFDSPESLDILLALGGDPNSDPLAAISSNRVLSATTVPEPSSACMVATMIGLVSLRRRR